MPYGARNSPIRRVPDSPKARQVDCIVGNDAYEFKLRVTIAASGQGRFKEELAFAQDCRASNFNPILLVLDPTPSSRLNDLSTEYARFGGCAYVGDQAWQHLEEQAGPTMATFVERYVRRPIAALDEYADELLDFTVSAAPNPSAFHFQPGDQRVGHRWTVRRAEDRRLADQPDGGDEGT